MSRDEVTQRIKDILEEQFSIEQKRVTKAATFRGTLEMDSLDIVDLVFFLQQSFGLQDSLKDYSELHTVDQLVDYLTANAR